MIGIFRVAGWNRGGGNRAKCNSLFGQKSVACQKILFRLRIFLPCGKYWANRELCAGAILVVPGNKHETHRGWVSDSCSRFRTFTDSYSHLGHSLTIIIWPLDKCKATNNNFTSAILFPRSGGKTCVSVIVYLFFEADLVARNYPQKRQCTKCVSTQNAIFPKTTMNKVRKQTRTHSYTQSTCTDSKRN